MPSTVRFGKQKLSLVKATRFCGFSFFFTNAFSISSKASLATLSRQKVLTMLFVLAVGMRSGASLSLGFRGARCFLAGAVPEGLWG